MGFIYSLYTHSMSPLNSSAADTLGWYWWYRSCFSQTPRRPWLLIYAEKRDGGLWPKISWWILQPSGIQYPTGQFLSIGGWMHCTILQWFHSYFDDQFQKVVFALWAPVVFTQWGPHVSILSSIFLNTYMSLATPFRDLRVRCCQQTDVIELHFQTKQWRCWIGMDHSWLQTRKRWMVCQSTEVLLNQFPLRNQVHSLEAIVQHYHWKSKCHLWHTVFPAKDDVLVATPQQR